MEDENATGLKDSESLSENGKRLHQVLNHHVGTDNIEARVRERQLLNVATHQFMNPFMAQQAREAHVDPHYAPGLLENFILLTLHPAAQGVMTAAKVEPRTSGRETALENLVVSILRVPKPRHQYGFGFPIKAI
jgi:hypothetical protein